MSPNPRPSGCVKVYADLLRKTIRLLTSHRELFLKNEIFERRVFKQHPKRNINYAEVFREMRIDFVTDMNFLARNCVLLISKHSSMIWPGLAEYSGKKGD